MGKNNITLFEMANSPYGLVISPISDQGAVKEGARVAEAPHRHDYYSLFLLEKGTISFIIDSEPVTLKSSSLMLISPGQVHQYLEAKHIAGWVLAFDGKNLDSKSRSIVDQNTARTSFIDLTANELQFFLETLSALYQATQLVQIDVFKLQILHSLLNAVFYTVANKYLTVSKSDRQISSRAEQITQLFRDMVKSNLGKQQRPAEYASKMNISVNYLNDAVKHVTGFSTTYLLHQEIIGEAQRQLLYTGRSVKEIAGFLGYDDYKYFIRLFTKTTKITPLRFRTTNAIEQLNLANHVVVFRTDLDTVDESSIILQGLKKLFPYHEINFDLEDCDRILRFKGIPLNSKSIIAYLRDHHHKCEELSF